MTPSELLGRLADSEDNLVERKPEGVNGEELRRTICAFANSVRGSELGVLFIGIHDDGRVLGVTNPDQIQKTIRRVCEVSCFPPISFISHVLRKAEKAVVAVVISESMDRPHFTGPAYVRRGSESVNASKDLFEEMVASRHSLAGPLLKMRGQLVTVICKQHILGSTKYVADKNYRAKSDCRIEDCDSHILRMHDIGRSVNVSEPLINITISYDEERRRPMLIVSGNIGQ